jgi:O-succinylbenzoic acid--CoA ligase
LRFEDVVKMDAGPAQFVKRRQTVSHQYAPRIQADVPTTIIFTSGSTGTPKAAVQSYANHYFSAAASNSNLPVGPGDRWLLSLSLHHVAGLGVLFRCAAGGAAVVIPPPEESIEDAIVRTNVTHVSLVPTQLYRLLEREQGREALKKLNAILVGGGAIPEAMIREADRLSLPIFTTYGLTEMTSQVATTCKGDPLDRLLTSGKPLLPDTLRIDTDGEILLRGDTLFLGYLGAERLERPLTPDGWFRTGDLGRVDCQGYLSVIGRKDNMFVCGGENVHPEEIEQHLRRIPGLRSAVVVPVPDAEFGAIPICFVMMEKGFETDAATLAKALTEALPRHIIPRRFFPWPGEFEPGDMKLNRSILNTLARQLVAGSTL